VHFRNPIGNPPEIFPLTDIDGDRRAEFAVVRPASDYSVTGRGEFAVLFETHPSGGDIDFMDLLAEPDVAVFSSAKPLGHEVWVVADFDGDGAGDILTRSSNVANALGPPEIVVIRGPIQRGEKLDLDTAPDGRVFWFFDSSNTDHFAQGLAGAGDMDGDGLGDIAFWSNGRDDSTRILLGHSPASSHADIADLEASGGPIMRFDHADSLLTEGYRVEAVGDVDGDGLSDILVHGSTHSDQNRGYAAILRGRETPPLASSWVEELTGSRALLIRGVDPVEIFGQDADAGDLDGDGKSDLVVGASRENEIAGLPVGPGEVRIFHSISGLQGELARSDVPRPATLIRGRTPTDRFGWTVEVLGDQDGDQVPELLVEATFADLSGQPFVDTVGHAYLIPGASILRGASSTRFRRGDANSDGEVNIADPIRILGALFLGTEPIACEDRGDSNDDGLLNLTDAIYLLNHLFNGDAAPPPPYPDPGDDPTADDLACAPPP
jgi:hypothetical protein